MNKIERGDRAKRLLEDELLLEALDALDEGAIEAFDAAPMNHPDALLLAKARRMAVHKFRQYFMLAVRDGKQAALKLMREKQNG